MSWQGRSFDLRLRLDYLSVLGIPLIQHPTQMRQAIKALAEEARQRQQAEAHYRTDVNRRALLMAERFSLVPSCWKAQTWCAEDWQMRTPRVQNYYYYGW
jgi:hypothetical protein